MNKNRVIGSSVAAGTFWGGSISALGFVWYKDFEKTDFHSFNDGNEWGQMDKAGHIAAAWYFTRVTSGMYRWSGVERRKASLIGAGISFGYMATFEILDGFNADWGFSWWDIGSNTLGSLVHVGQEYAWEEQRIKFKFSFHNSGLSDYRPNVLGDNFFSRSLKDYNGQTYWVSFNPITIFNQESKVPKWLNLSFGYSIDHQLIGDGGIYVHTNSAGDQQEFVPYRQFYLSFDIDLEDIPVKNKFLRALFKGLNVIKLPFPALEVNTLGKVEFRPFYF